ncbi:restriction endonuclease subunit S [Marinobacter bryozoorum]|uniref:restriction endonuclease subunit S n=1 Tax=Marinobacter bryozoorum TaxID=256324 RepID=UPI0020039B5A|nr:restriction endonuclease subunit S [Marinobacter bryozoorum]MCK7545180.1 restriction endonuclease subunit S [Marinobacter bryozoorum]
MSDYQRVLADLPDDWKTAKIEDLGSVVSGGTPSREITNYWGGTIPWVTPGEVTTLKEKTLRLTHESITNEGLRQSGANLLPAGSLLVTTRASLGYCAINSVPVTTNQGFKSIVFRQSSNPDFYYYWTRKACSELKRRASGTTFLEISGSDFKQIKFPVPPSAEQRKIAQILDTLNTQIQKTEALIGKLEKIKEGLLHDLLTRGIDQNGQLRPTPEQAPELYRESALGLIPKEWKVRELEDVASVERGQFTHRPRNDPKFYGGPYPFIQTGDIARSRGKLVSLYSQTLSSRGLTASKKFPAGTIAVTIAANIADSAILAIPMYFPDSIVGIIPSEGVSTRFIELCIRRAKQHLDARAPQSAQKNINLQDLRPLKIPFPGQSEQQQIAEAYESIAQRIARETHCLTKLSSQKTGLMDDLLTGRVRVTPLLKDAV